MNASSFLLAMLAVFISSLSQVILKKAAIRNAQAPFLKKFLNFPVIAGYGIMLLSTLVSVYSLRRLDMRFTPAANATGLLWVVLFAYLFFREKPNRNQVLGMGIILCGIVVSII